jgi:tRNA U34 5-methylaminomethyl-2-thiouridine-forming methyltransferase MnmC
MSSPTGQFAQAIREGQKLWSPRFEDVYFDQEEGLDESRYVFVQGNQVDLRWEKDFTVGELGFGTGMNLLVTQEVQPPDSQLNFYTVEKYPFGHQELRDLWEGWSVPAPFLEDFLGQYAPKPGWQQIIIPGLSLHLFVGEVLDFLHSIPTKADAWYLDGFSPRKNPQMWSVPVMEGVFAATKPQGTLATFSASGLVKANLRSAGFEIARKKGFGRKKHMVIGQKNS